MDNHKEYQLINQLKEKYSDNENEFLSALEGLLHQKGTFYWEYISLNQLQNMQFPKSNFPDEMIFIVYHQICELYFKLILHELKILTHIENREFLIANNWFKRIGRCINYYQKLSGSIDIMQPGTYGETNQFFSTEEFSKFRLALAPASGFQSVSIREIEIYCTSIQNLSKQNPANSSSDLSEQFKHLYWKSGSLMTNVDGEKMKTKTLLTFEEKYDKYLFDLAQKMQFRNIEYLFSYYKPDHEEDIVLLEEIRSNNKIIDLLIQFDEQVNIEWKHKHLMVIRQHLKGDEYGTGGTNWKDYLPPKLQNISFFPKLK